MIGSGSTLKRQMFYLYYILYKIQKKINPQKEDQNKEIK
jgi:hypothetical protein